MMESDQNQPLKIPPPDFSLISKHDAQVAGFRKAVVERLQEIVKAGHAIIPQAFIFGYDYGSRHYRTNNFQLDPTIWDNAEMKLHAYHWLRGLKKEMSYQALAMIFVAPGFVSDTPDEWEPVVYVTFETGLVSKCQLYRITVDMLNETAMLTLDADLSRKPVVDDMGEFMHLFSLDIVKN